MRDRVSLLELQHRFREEIVSGDDGPVPSSTGMAVYRQAYRNRLLEGLETTFEKTRRWAGEDAFAAVARHHILTHSPCSWTLDDYGADFPATLADLFQDNPEVAELAWLEWEMQRVFAAPDEPVFSPEDFQQLAAQEPDWNLLGFELCASNSLRRVRSACDELWLALERNEVLDESPSRTEPTRLIVWRNGLASQFRILDQHEGEALELVQRKPSFGWICSSLKAEVGEIAVAQLAQWLVRWIRDGLISQVIR